jgi:chitin disaccharide deacetylase
MSQLQKSQSNRLLGYPDDARLLIINADDFGLCQGINYAILDTITKGVVCSTTLMIPCPWASHAMKLLARNPDIAFGVHLTVICETVDGRWAPFAPADKVPSLIDETGNCFSYERIPEFLARAQLDEVELEFRTQIEVVLQANLKPTHLDWHCLHNGGRHDIFEMTVSLAKEYGLAVRVAGQAESETLQKRGLPTTDHGLMDSFRLDTVDKSARYIQMLRELPVGLTEWAVHPGFDDAELQTIQPDGAQVRQTDFDFLMSPEAHEAIEQEGIVLLNYRPLQEIWQKK